jgi:hypothetical protein
MRLLRLVGPGEDGTSVIVEAVDPGSLDGERFELSLDDRLRTLATTEPATPAEQAQPRPASSGPIPTPREIQVRVRAGETAQAVADQAGIPLERVMRFAYPVLQERVRVTDEARRARARRGGDGLLVPFGELIDLRFGRHGVDPAAVRWDAYRREDGGWTVTSEVSSHQRTVLAKFSFALLNRTVSALDDIAADLLSDRPVQALLPPPAAEPVAETPADSAPDWDAEAPPPRLTAVPNPNRVDAPRPQEPGPAVRPPSRRQKAHTRPVPVDTDDELFDQDAFEQQPWHEPQLPFEIGSSGRGTQTPGTSPRHRAQRSAGARSDSAAPDIAEAASADPGRDVPEIVGVRFDSAGVDPAGVESAGVESAGVDPAGVESAGVESAGVESAGVESAGVEPAGVELVEVPAADLAPAGIAADSQEVRSQDDAAAPGDLQNRRGRRSGDKPRMPSWDDILLGVRHKSD